MSDNPNIFIDDELEEHGEHAVLVEQITDLMPGSREIENVTEFFKILGDPTRVRILAALSGGELCVSDISAALGMERTAISHQLRILRSARLVRARRDGKMICYSFDDEHVSCIIKMAIEHVKE